MSPLRPLLVTLLLGSAAGLTGTMTAAPALTRSSTSVSLHGTYQIVTADLVGSHGEYIGERYRPVLQVGAVTYPLRLPPRVRLRGGAGIAVIGSISAGTVTASSVQSAPASTAPAVATSGVSTSVLVILAEWQGKDRMTTAAARRVMFTDGAQWYSEVSNGAVTQHGDVTPWVHIAGPPGGQCFTGGPTILSQAEAAAHTLGFDPATYDRTVVYFPNQNSGASGCQGISGFAEEPGHHVWLNGYLDLPSITHEQGHNYGLSHAHAYTCSAGVLIGTCTFAEYGDPYDTMGPYGGAYSFSAKQRSQLGWLTPEVLTVGSSAVLAPLEGASGVRGAVIHATATRDYWLEYRRRLAPDTSLPTGAVNGVLVHLVDRALTPPPQDQPAAVGPALLDMTPADHTLADATIKSGQSWQAPEGFRLSVGGVTAAGAAVSISSGRPAVADFTGAGRSEPAVYRPSTATWWIRGLPPVTYGATADVPVPVDYDGDGRADLAVWRPSTGQWWIRGHPAVAWGLPGDIPVPADYDGNGRADLAIWRPSTGRWWVHGGATTAWGLPGDIPVPGDYSGDRRADLAVWRPSTGTWWVHSGATTPWGGAGDIPVAGDFTGTGRTGMAVWSPSTGVWSAAATPPVTWGRSGDIPLPVPPGVRMVGLGTH